MKNFTSMLLIMATLFISLPVYSVSVWDGTAEMWTVGSGTESDPYQIQTAQNLAYLAQSVNSGNSYSDKFFIQTDDINLNNIEWTSIGGQYDRVNYETSHFDASFDGANHSISNVKISGVGDGTYGVGLFGYCKGGGALKNINATVDVNFSNSNSVGGIVGYSEVPMVNCSARGTINYSSVGVGTGGVAGYSGSEMSLCINYCDITGDGSSAVGGVVGRANHGGGLNYCTNYGDIKSELGGYYYFGGVVAECDGNINGCVNYGDVSGAYYCSGVVVYASSSNSTISLCKNFGNITAGYENNQERSYATGVVYSSSGNVQVCVNYGNVSSSSRSYGIACYVDGIIEKCSNHGAVSAISTSEEYYGVAYGISNNGYIIYCYNTGTITATTAYGCAESHVINSYNVGNLIGGNKFGLANHDVTNSFYLESCGGLGAGISMSSAQMQSSSFIEALNAEGYVVFIPDIKGINNMYPILFFEQIFNVVFKNYDGAVMQSEKLILNSMPVYKGQTPVRQSDAQGSYSFSGWNPAITPVTSDQIYIAQFSTVNKYTVRFLNEDGTELQSEELEYGTVPVYTGETPTKDATAQYTYTFNGWDSEIEKVTGAKDYTATYSSTVNKYLITFENYDGTELQSKEVSYGDTPVYTGETPSRPSTVQYTYTFIGWDSEIVAVDESKTYTAQFSSTVNKYLITFENYDGTELQSKEVSYGDTPVYTGVTPVKPSTAQYTYSFSGWDSEIVAVDESKTYTAQYSSTVNKYVIRFLNEDGTELQSEELEYGTIPVYKGETPGKQSTAQYTYTFNGWDSEIGKVTGAKDYIATYSSTINKYLITFENYNGDELQSGEVEYGQTPAYTGATPEKPADAEFTYTFSGWSPDVVSVVGAQTYTAQFSSTVNKYVIRFLNEDGTELQNEELDYGVTPVYKGTEPSKAATKQYSYTFAGWNNTIVPVDGAKDYTAIYSSTVNRYLITFENYDGTELQRKEVSYGDTPVYTGATPVRPSTAQYTYNFTGWDSEIVAVDETKTYTAQFSSTVNKYTVRFLNEDGTELQSEELEYGVTPVYKGTEPSKAATKQYSYTFAGWNNTIVPVDGAKDYTATYSSTVNRYLITFENYDGTELQRKEVSYGDAPVYTGATPVRPSTAQYTYNFTGWDSEIVAVDETKTYTAQFSSTVNKYTVRFLNEDGTVLQTENLEYGTVPVYKGETPTKQPTAQYTYTFNGWDSEIGKVTGVKNYTATYSSTVNKYLITFENYNGTELQSSEVKYGQIPAYTGATPEKPADAEFTYTFSGWSPEVVAVVGTQTYTAQFNSTVNKYVIRFLNEDGTELQNEELDYGTIPVYKGETPTKQPTAQYTYTFNGWDSEIGTVTGAKDYIATYSSTINKYLITFENYDGTELQRKEVSYGDTPVYTGATPVRPSTAQYTYNFSGWDSEIVAVDESKTYTAQYSSTVNKYTVRFLNEDGTELQNEELDYGTIPVYKGETPTKQPTAQYTYTFNGWDSEIGTVTGAKDYIATYSSTINKYLITFENYDGTELQRKEVSYGDTPVYTGATPVRPSTAQYTYNFTGWDSEMVAVDESKTYTAQYSSTVNKYTVRFLNEDGTELQNEELEYGAIPVYSGEVPTKQPTAQYTYTFNGWDSEIGKVTGPKDYTATYSNIVNKYLITFENYDGTELQRKEVSYGDTPVYTGATPVRPSTAQYTYTFNGWDSEIGKVTGAKDYTATYSSTVNKYVIRFLNEDDSELQREELEYGTLPVYSGETPTKQPTAQYTYTFNGWDSEIGKVTGVKNYTATYSSTVNKYLITFENYNGTELQSSEVKYGQIPAYTGATPEKPADAEFTYTFSGWSPEVVAVVGTQTYTAQFSSTVNKYTVRFLNEDGTELQNEELDYGTIPVYKGETPTKQPTAQYTYTFNGWDSEIGKVTGAKDYTATYTSTVNKYLITFKNHDGTELQSGEVEYGQIPSYTGNTPEKPADAEFTYTFSGWSPDVVSVVGAQTYTAQFSSTVNKYVIRFLNEDGTELQSEELNYGTVPVYKVETPTKQPTAQYTYTFNGWDSEIGKVTGAKDYIATYTSTVNKYLITFENYNGDELQSSEVEYGQTPAYTGTIPEKPADAEFTYTFSGWSPEVVAVVGAQTYTAQFSSTVNKYVIRFLNEDGTELQSEELNYGTVPVYKVETPTKQPTAQYTYTFNGWDSEIGKVTGAKDYIATYTSTVNKYLITFENYNGDELQSGEVEYGQIPSYTGATPEKPADAEFTYTFSGWSPELVSVVGAQTYTAQFISTTNKYVIRFLNEDGAELQSEELDYGTIPVYSGETPTKDATAQYTYTFNGWDSEIGKVTGAKDYTATYSSIVNKYTVTLSGINCDVTGDGVYDYGTIVELNAIPNDGYVFQNWSDGNTDNPRTIVVDRDYDISVKLCKTSFETISATIFKGDYYEFGDKHLTQRGTYTETFLNKAGCDSVVVLTLSVIPVPTYNVRLSVYKDDTWGSVIGDGTYRKGATATLNAVPASGYKFSYWYDQDTQERFYENPLSLVVERAVSLTASFSRAPKIKVTYGQRSAEAEGDGEDDVISYVVSTKQHVDIDNVGSRSILIYNTAGQIMLRQVNVEHYEGHLPSGVYIINIDGVMEKFIVR